MFSSRRRLLSALLLGVSLAITTSASGKITDHPDVSGSLALLDRWIEAHQIYERVPGISVGVVLDQNLKETKDLRADWFNALEISITDLVFLRTSFRILWRNDPLFESLPLYDSAGNPVLDGNGDPVSVPSQLDPVDTYFLTSLGLKF